MQLRSGTIFEGSSSFCWLSESGECRVGFRFRLGPFTFGRTGTRLSLWRKRGGVSVPLTGKSKNTFGVLRAGPFRWFFSKKLVKKRQHDADKDGFPMRGEYYKCPHCHRFSARRTNSWGSLTLLCTSCGTKAKATEVTQVRRGLIFRRTVGKVARFRTETPAAGAASGLRSEPSSASLRVTKVALAPFRLFMLVLRVMLWLIVLALVALLLIALLSGN